ncbi:MAG: glucose 1-dehydrogenase [Frankia sp.]|nr:glucose 1-dehydrogenase [Frankia sp.]
MAVPTLRADGKVVVITGASRGLGRAMALGFAEGGADVVVSSRRLAGCEAVADEVRALGRKALAVACHVGDWNQCADLVTATVAEFGRIDVLVNNAGIAPVPPSLSGITEELYAKTMDVNFKGPLRLIGLAAEHMGPGSAVINISSVASIRPSPFTVVYAAAKAAQNALTVAAARELGPRDIRVNGIICGTFHTDSFHRSAPTEEARENLAKNLSLGRIGYPEEIVGTALYLASDASSYLTGQLVRLDGGGS